MSQDINSGPWNPSPAEFRAYLDREVEMAKELLEYFGMNIKYSTLYSDQTIRQAIQELRGQ